MYSQLVFLLSADAQVLRLVSVTPLAPARPRNSFCRFGLLFWVAGRRE
jgi:hypothetical protein